MEVLNIFQALRSRDFSPDPKLLGGHHEKLKALEATGADQFNLYWMTRGQDETLNAYGKRIIPAIHRQWLLHEGPVAPNIVGLDRPDALT